MGDRDFEAHLKAILIDHKLHFSSRASFNDPFDLVMPPLRAIPPRFLSRFVADRLRATRPDQNRAARRKAKKEMTGPKGIADLQRQFQEYIDGTGILSLTERPDDLLMWAHYASGHSGVCLMFRIDPNQRRFARPLPVVYSAEWPLFDPRKSEKKRIEAAFLTKSAHWAYEREWRILEIDVEPGNIPFPSEWLIGVIFGCRLLEQERTKVRSWLTEADSEMPLYEAVQNERKFSLDIRRLG